MDQTSSGGFHWVGIPLFIAFAATICGTNDSYYITGLILAGVFFFRTCKQGWRFSWLDLSLLAVWLYEALLLCTSVYPPAGCFSFGSLTAAVIYYFVLRSVLNAPVPTQKLLLSYSVLFSLLACIAVIAFVLFEQQVRHEGFESFYELRYRYLPLGVAVNGWGNLLLGFLGIQSLALYYYRRHKTLRIWLALFCLLTFFCLILTFSRGIYLAVAWILVAGVCLALFGRKQGLRKKIFTGVLLSVVVGALALPYRHEVLKTWKMHETVSQQRSTEGRIRGGQAAYRVWKKHPVMGVGSGNFSMALNEEVYENDNNNFIPRSFSTLFQIFVEKGLLGAVIWLLPVGVLLGMFVRRKPKGRDDWIIVIILAAIAIRECTFPVLLDEKGSMMLVLTFLAVFQGRYTLSAPVRSPIYGRLLCWVFLSIAICMGFFYARKVHTMQSSIRLYQLVEEGDLHMARHYLDQMEGGSFASLINGGALDLKLFRETGDSSFLEQAESKILAAQQRNAYDVHLQHVHASILYAKGSREEALDIAAGLVARFPENSLYRVALFEILYKKGAGREAIPHLTKAILLEPALLNTPLWNDLAGNDTVLQNTVKKYLLNSCLYKSEDQVFEKKVHKNKLVTHPDSSISTSDIRDRDPLELARFGKILLELEDTLSAQRYLEAAVEYLPNLPRPWCYLGIIAYGQGDDVKGRELLERSVFLNPGDQLVRAWHDYYLNGGKSEGKKVEQGNNYDFLHRKYSLKFSKWYRAMPVTFQTIGY